MNLSILFPYRSTLSEEKDLPEFFNDLNLDLMIKEIVSFDKEIDSTQYYLDVPSDLDTVYFRQKISQDLMDVNLQKTMKQLCRQMDRIQRNINFASKLDNIHNRNGWYLNIILEYQSIVQQFSENLDERDIKSEGLLSIRKAVSEIVKDQKFVDTCKRADELNNQLQNVRYSLVIKGNMIRVYKVDNSINLNDQIQSLFSRFDRREVRDYHSKFSYQQNMNHVEAQIVDHVAMLFPQPFKMLNEFISENPQIVHPIVEMFNKEIRFYVNYFYYIDVLKIHIPFSLPEISKSKIFQCKGFIDLALAKKADFDLAMLVSNDIYVNENQHFIIITGPNQGGKTTFLRAIGQMHYLAKLGLPVSGENAMIPWVNLLFTHFEIEESVTTLQGRLKNDLIRMRKIIENASSDSLILVNEMLSSTVLHDALHIYKRILVDLKATNARTFLVTFIDELSTFDENTLSLVSQVNPSDPTVRTFKVIPAPASGKSYAHSIAVKYGCTKSTIERMIQDENTIDV